MFDWNVYLYHLFCVEYAHVNVVLLVSMQEGILKGSEESSSMTTRPVESNYEEGHTMDRYQENG